MNDMIEQRMRKQISRSALTTSYQYKTRWLVVATKGILGEVEGRCHWSREIPWGFPACGLDRICAGE